MPNDTGTAKGTHSPKETDMPKTNADQCKAAAVRRALSPTLLAPLAAACISMHAPAANAEGDSSPFPGRMVKIVVPAAPGGGIDIIARSVSDKLAAAWGHQVIVENRPGANFVIGTDAVAKSPADGYTLLMTSYGAITVNPIAYPNLPYDPKRDLTPVMLVTGSPFVLLARKQVGTDTLPQFIANLRAKPGKLNHASNSASTILASELFKSMAQVDYADINYKGGILAAQSVAAGETDFALVDLGSALATERGGRVKALAVTTAARSRLMPDIPTFAEGGVIGYSADAWIVLLAPAKTPANVVNKINADLKRILDTPEVTARIETAGNEVVGSSPAQARKILADDADKWAQLVKQRNLKFQQ
jgi:tripartite-type tricarboxylate transporter receptor subunit TctC